MLQQPHVTTRLADVQLPLVETRVRTSWGGFEVSENKEISSADAPSFFLFLFLGE
jgi:hypothetical protein